ncbi:thioredoxin [Streptomyces uncialis]|uniref:Thioredoxin n=1 Tax=Streptomyces uncialis TaxID=1048205 RepID=A0A1Q4UYL9_9ACTN|nr:thioredoxin [Streptomyces uncialis]MCX4662453.1 thioredoxin [Streptomyces uncialis]OKH90654.1 thioredoxin [Streptomyces uncialis]
MTAEATGVRVQEALDRLTGSGALEAGEELVRELLSFYGEGLTALVGALPPGALDPALDHPAAAGLLVLHELHPEGVDQRIARALAGLPGDPAALVGYEPGSGTLTLRRAESGGGCGCGGGGGEQEIEDVIACHAPEVTAVVWERAPALLQIGSRPPVPTEVR